jgi:hypothetical protein
VLRMDDAQRMVRSHDQAMMIEVPDVGHAPMFYSLDQIDLVGGWLSPSARPPTVVRSSERAAVAADACD